MRDASHKLSKRDGDAYFSDFKEKGYLSGAIVNYIALLGWSPHGKEAETEIFNLAELTEAFDIKGISKAPAIFDEAKMKSINSEYIRNLPAPEFKKLILPYIVSQDSGFKIQDSGIDILCSALQPRTELISALPAQIDFLSKIPDYSVEIYNNKKMKTSPETALIALKEIIPVIKDTDNFIRDNIYNSLKELSEKTEKKIGWYLYPLQVALSGKMTAPGGGLDICVMFGKDESLKRIEEAIIKLKDTL
jgi:glutamyl-tRNA synthetase